MIKTRFNHLVDDAEQKLLGVFLLPPLVGRHDPLHERLDHPQLRTLSLVGLGNVALVCTQ